MFQFAVNATALGASTGASLRAMLHSLGRPADHPVAAHSCERIWSWCPGLGRSLNGARERRARREWRIVLSVSMFEPAWYVRETMENALARTENTTLIVLHLNAGTNYSLPAAKVDMEWLWEQDRIEVSCFRHRVEAYSGTVLLSQLSNLLWAQCRGLVQAATHVVFQASNMWWWRSGMEAAVRARNSSTPRIRTDTECAAYVQTHVSKADGMHQLCFPVSSSECPITLENT